MKKIIYILSGIAFAVGILMASLDLYNSWSEHEGTPEEPFLTVTLLCIILTFYTRALTFPEYQHRVWSGIITAMFCGVLIFSVNHPDILVNSLHLAFTGAGIGTAYISQLIYFERRTPAFYGSIAGSIVGIGLFLGGYWMGWYTVATGEVLAAWPIIIFIIGTNKLK
jgi:hypothetical protein